MDTHYLSRHETADGILTHSEADRLREHATRLVADLAELKMPSEDGGNALMQWAGRAGFILEELARG